MSDLKERMAEITELLSLPDIVIKINKLVNSSNSSATDIAEVITSDISLSTKILKLVNSPFYGFSKQITNINYAIVILGFNAIRNLALTTFILDIRKDQMSGFDSQGYWSFSVNTGAVAEILAHDEDINIRADAFISGLLHDFGILILNQYFTDEFIVVKNYAQENHCTLLEAESTLLDFDHIQLATMLLEEWNIPDRITNVCRYYSCPEDSAERLPALIHLADFFCKVLGLGIPYEQAIPEISHYALDKLEIDLTNIYAILKDILEKTATTSEL